MSAGGYIAIHRKMFENPLFVKFPEYIGPWVWMIAQARYVANGIGRGQLRLSKRLLHRQFPHLSVTKCERFLGHLSGHRMIKIEPQSGTQLSLITVCNYDIYQVPQEEHGPLGGPLEIKTGPQSGPSLNKEEEGKEDSKPRLSDPIRQSDPIEQPCRKQVPTLTQTAIAKAVQEIWNQFAAKHGLPACKRLSKKRITAIVARLKAWTDGRELQDFERTFESALDRIVEAGWMFGSNDRGWRVQFDFLCQESSFDKLMEGVYVKSGKQQIGHKTREETANDQFVENAREKYKNMEPARAASE